MGTRANLSRVRRASRSKHAVLLVGELPGALGRKVRRTLGDHLTLTPDLSSLEDDVCFDVALRVCPREDRSGEREFALWARQTGVPALTLMAGAAEVAVGPLVYPDRSPCGYCVWARMTAATAGNPWADSGGCDGANLSIAAERAVLRRIRDAVFDAVSPVDDVLVVEATGAISMHRVIPLPECPVCGGAASYTAWRDTARLSSEDSPDDVLAQLPGLLDPRTGIIPCIVLEPHPDEAPGLPYIATAAPPHLVNADGSLRQLPIGWGKGRTISGAVLSAAGEAFERYAASLPDATRIRWCRSADLEGEILKPAALALYSEEQYATPDFPYARYDADAKHPWVLGRWLGSGTPVWVPAIAAYLSLRLQRDQLICQGTSNGLAAGTDMEHATARAALELIERDAMLATWLTHTPGHRVSIDRDAVLDGILQEVRASGASVEMYLLPASACGATALCLACGDGESYPAATIGLGSDLDAYSAVLQAALETAQTGPHLCRMMRSTRLRVPERPQDVREMLDHAAYFFPGERAAEFEWLRSGAACTPVGELRDSAPATLDVAPALVEKRIRVAIVDVTSADLAIGPFRVVRAVSPDLQPLSYGFGLNRIPVERIRRMGIATPASPIHPIW